MTIMIDTFLISVFSSSLAAFGMFLWQILKCNLYFLDHIKWFPINAHFMCVIVVFALIMTLQHILLIHCTWNFWFLYIGGGLLQNLTL